MAGNYGATRNKYKYCFEIMLIEAALCRLNDEQYLYALKEATSQFNLKTPQDYEQYLGLVDEMQDHHKGNIFKVYWDRASEMFADFAMAGNKNPYFEIADKYKELIN